MSKSTTDIADRLLTPEQAAEYLNVSKDTLADWRARKRYTLRFIRVGTCVRYRLSDLEDFLASRTVPSTVSTPAAPAMATAGAAS